MECTDTTATPERAGGLVRLRVAGGVGWIQTSPSRPSAAMWRAAVEAYVGGASLAAAVAGRGMTASGLQHLLGRMGLQRPPAQRLRVRVLSAEDVQRAARLLALGMNASQAAAVIGIPVNPLCYALRNAGLALDHDEARARSLRCRRVAQRRAEAQRRIAAGEPTADIAADLGVSRSQVNAYRRHPSNPFRCAR